MECISCFTALCFTVLCRYCVFYKLKVCGNLALRELIDVIFPTAFVNFVSHFVNIRNISNFSIIILFVMVIFDVTIVIVWECHEPCPYKMANLTDKCCVCSDCYTDWPFPCLSPLPSGLPFPRDTILKLGQLITLQWPLSVQVKGRVSRFLKSKS